MKKKFQHNSSNKTFGLGLLVLALMLLYSGHILAQSSVLVNLNNSKRKLWIDLKSDIIGIESDNQFFEDYASSITNKGIVFSTTNRLFSWSEIQSISVSNRYRGKKVKAIYWSLISAGLFMIIASDLYERRIFTYRYYPLSYYIGYSAPFWGILFPVSYEIFGGTSKRVKLPVEGEVLVIPYKDSTRFPINQGGPHE